MVKLVDTLDLGSSALRCEGSSPFIRTLERMTTVKRNSLIIVIRFIFLVKIYKNL